MPITLDGTNGITTPTYGGADTSEYLVPVTQFKNRIINGAMQIDQRNAGASTTPTTTGSGVYALDRWVTFASQASKFSIQQNAGSVTPPAGFTNYLGITSLAATSVGASDYFIVSQKVEGFNVADLNWGTANAQSITISFWVRSSLTGTFGGVVTNNAQNRTYPYTYTISSANTWEQKSVTIAGDTTGTWLKDNSTGLWLIFGFGAGSSQSGTAGSWQASGVLSATGATSVVGTNGATWYITGVQLEVGSTATSFDYRPYGTELALCQRYFETSYAAGTAVGTITDVNTCMWLSNRNPGTPHVQLRYVVQKRATPTFTTYNSVTGATNSIRDLDAAANYTAVWGRDGNNGGTLYANSSIALGNFLQFHYTASAEL